jgi:hypothetical protein
MTARLDLICSEKGVSTIQRNLARKKRALPGEGNESPVEATEGKGSRRRH